jgi:hypothetical protein
MGTFCLLLSGLKLSGERDGGLGLARFPAVCPLGGHVAQMAFGYRQDFVAEAGAPRKSVGSWELFVGT